MSKEETEIKQKTNANQAAFPTELKMSNSADKGLTKLEYFTAAALQGLLSNPEIRASSYRTDWAASKAVKYAVETLEELSKINQ